MSTILTTGFYLVLMSLMVALVSWTLLPSNARDLRDKRIFRAGILIGLAAGLLIAASRPF